MIAAVYFFAYLYFASELLPPLTALLRRPVDRTRSKVVLFCLVMFLFDMVLIGFQHRASGGNVWLSYIVHPTEAVLVCWILSDWQVRPGTRRALGYLVPVYLITMTILTLTEERSDTFSLITGSLSGLAILCLVLYTLVSNSLLEREELRHRDWFWVCLGFTVYFCVETGVEPVERLLLSIDLPALIRLAIVKPVVETVAMVLIARGMFCPVRPPGQDRVLAG
ncbi:MAG: hypothetical protein ABI765_08500 [Gemmatimonadota bacterium]